VAQAEAPLLTFPNADSDGIALDEHVSCGTIHKVDEGGHVVSRSFLCSLFYRWGRRILTNRDHQINDDIRAREVRLIGADGEQVGIVSLREALQMATEAQLDLVNIAPTAKPPVCRMMDYGKFRYEQQKKEKENRKNQKIVEVKEVRFSARIDDHDFQTKLRSVIKFLNEEDKVKCTIKFRGREIMHAIVGQRVLERVAADTDDIAIVERKPKLEGRSMIMILAPKG
jgi:translation initiation factor IF-3